MKDIKGEIVKRYMYRDKMVFIARIQKGDDSIYTFKISSRANQKDYFSNDYASLEKCEADSYKVVRGV